MKNVLFLLAITSSSTLLAQSNATGKMTSGLSIALTIMLGLVIYMVIKNSKLQRENMRLRQQLEKKS